MTVPAHENVRARAKWFTSLPAPRAMTVPSKLPTTMSDRERRESSLLARVAAACLLTGPLAGCGDPVRDDAIAALGPEEPGVRPGPSHRPGQPCVLCHDQGEKAPPFSLAGTVYVDAMSNTPIGDVSVIILDAAGAEFTTITNCAGNFFIRPEEFTPTYPIWINMRAGAVHRSMETASYREPSCAACHSDPRSRTSAGHVYLIDDPTVETAPASRCN
jgi:hypothetical protein